jgi:nucleotide-binding universal stress UspA family protein
MVYVDAEGDPQRRVRLSARLADKFNSTLIGISASAFRPPMMVDGLAVPGAMDVEIESSTKKLAGREQLFCQNADADHRKLVWRTVFDFPAAGLAREARSADLVIIGLTAGPGDVYSSLNPGDVLLRLGRPALLVPNEVSSLLAEHVVIGWKDAREARRAVVDALPFLHGATGITIAEVCLAGEERAAEARLGEVARYLGAHRITSKSRVVLHQHGSGAAELIGLVKEEHADLLVAGAYGHSRLGEWIFGGVTRDLLSTSPVCCLMSH